MTDKIVVRTNIMLKPYDMDELRRRILKQAEDGVIVVPRYCEILYPDEKILEQIRAEIENIKDFEVVNGALYVRQYDVVQIIDKYMKGE